MNHDDILWIAMISDMRYIWVHPKWRCGSLMNILESLLRGVKDIPCRWLLWPFAIALGHGTRRSHRQRWTERSSSSRLCSRAQPKEKFSLAVKESRELSLKHRWRGDCMVLSSLSSSLKLQIQFLIPCRFKRGHMDVGCSCSNEVWMSPST